MIEVINWKNKVKKDIKGYEKAFENQQAKVNQKD